ncbi:UPF0553 family protein, putative [Ichthyophthirius multifiliis]|uniref:Queuosine 5'-phosphate N-glycosylase/hydrolase n=1 Tax=Ichthyophthirius multifiliis TaxID=5932 RepID=G0QMM4_ICHMU|nr:UPF0553 family protein, putative [Ichthyophthirius multifiliis]EGR33530.1 UPF0553 family protein, putative [Ichthyophthirius multifiliis]|eukprot:XP_004037516.1 UPF0553 family protein, putative [Ichthyophthirius multifiliis]
MNKCQLVRQTSEYVLKNAKHSQVNIQNLKQLADDLLDQFQKGYKYTEFEEYGCHYSNFNSPEQTIAYIFILDTLNFCFWPCKEEFEYDDLANGVKNLIFNHYEDVLPKNIININEQFIKEQVFKNIDFPLIDERTRLLQEIGKITLNYFQGEYINIIKEANKSSVKLVDILTSFFNNFQDIAIYQGHQICFYKRAQILVADLFGAFKGQSFGEFYDIDQLTTFPDYRVPQILNQFQVIQYSNELQNIIDNKTIIQHGSEYEVLLIILFINIFIIWQKIEIRACTVYSVEELKKYLKQKGKDLHSIEIDWILWQKGEENRHNIKNHHRVLSIYY